jgi:hypothetical protein
MFQTLFRRTAHCCLLSLEQAELLNRLMDH